MRQKTLRLLTLLLRLAEYHRRTGLIRLLLPLLLLHLSRQRSLAVFFGLPRSLRFAGSLKALLCSYSFINLTVLYKNSAIPGLQ